MKSCKVIYNGQVIELTDIVREVLRSEISGFESYLNKKIEEEKSADFVDVKTLCKELSVTRQTISNWERGKVIGMSITGLFQKKGGRKFYDLNAIKERLEKKGRF